MYNKLRETLLHNPARKWLYVSLAGFLMCFLSVGLYLSHGGNTARPLPALIMKQVFGFTPYYFLDDKPPGKLSLKSGSAKFLGNALSFDLEKSATESVTISEKAAAANFLLAKKDGEISLDTISGTALLSLPKDGHVSGSLLTSDKTIIEVTAPDSLGSDLVESVLRALKPSPKDIANP